MKIKVSLAFLSILLVSAFAFCIFAQNQTEQLDRTPRVAPFVIGRGTGMGNVRATADVVLCKTDGVNIAKSFPSNGTLRIEYKNGSWSQIELSDVKKMTLTVEGHSR